MFQLVSHTIFVKIKDETGAYVNDATVTLNLLSHTGTAVPQIQDLDCPRDNAVAGQYKVSVDPTFKPDPGTYILRIAVSTPAGKKGRARKVVIVKEEEEL